MKTQEWTAVFLICILIQVSKQSEITACGRLQNILVPHITSGHDTHRWPWHAAIYHRLSGTGYTYQCGGTLISSSLILTAAHCVLIEPERVSVSLGRLTLNASDSIASFIKVARIKTHPEYVIDNNENDIALVTLSTNVIFNSYIQPICLWKSDKIDLSEVINKVGTVVGWGLTENGVVSNVLQEASLPVVSLYTCLKSNRDLFGRFLTDKNFCAGNRNGTHVCTGDSGGSMVFYDNGVYYIRGIVSVGATTLDPITNELMCDSTQYALFTDVAQYLPWIAETMEFDKDVRDSCVTSPCGDQCTTSTGGSGKCTKITECSPVQNDIREGITDHAVCPNDGSVPIVCCPSAQPATTTSSRVSERKCAEYNEFSYNKIYVTDTHGRSVERKVSNCSFAAVPLIVGGTEAKLREFPHMALIGFEDGNTVQWDCGGTLISEQFVLSAAHCFIARDYGPAKYVRLGELDLNRVDDGTAIDLRIIESFPHPEYHAPRIYNDIGLLKLERKIELSGAIRPACLPQVSAVSRRTATATGWGAVSWRGEQSKVLLKVLLELFSQSECNSSYDINRKLNKGIIEESQICAGSHIEEKDTCQGDAGGPLQIYHASHSCSYIVIGISSFGKVCGTIGQPSIYTRVFAYLDWIETIVWPNQ